MVGIYISSAMHSRKQDAWAEEGQHGNQLPAFVHDKPELHLDVHGGGSCSVFSVVQQEEEGHELGGACDLNFQRWPAS